MSFQLIQFRHPESTREHSRSLDDVRPKDLPSPRPPLLLPSSSSPSKPRQQSRALVAPPEPVGNRGFDRIPHAHGETRRLPRPQGPRDLRDGQERPPRRPHVSFDDCPRPAPMHEVKLTSSYQDGRYPRAPHLQLSYSQTTPSSYPWAPVISQHPQSTFPGRTIPAPISHSGSQGVSVRPRPRRPSISSVATNSTTMSNMSLLKPSHYNSSSTLNINDVLSHHSDSRGKETGRSQLAKGDTRFIENMSSDARSLVST